MMTFLSKALLLRASSLLVVTLLGCNDTTTIGASHSAIAPEVLAHPRSDWTTAPESHAGPFCGARLNPKFITIHHGGIEHKTRDAAKILNSYLNYHTTFHGWCDIGYHFFVNYDGSIWQARDESYQGIHACAANADNIGIVLPGNYQVERPGQAMLNSTARLLRWLADTYHLDLSTNTIKGHSDWPNGSECSNGKCACRKLECPGSNLYPLLPDIIDTAKSLCGTLAPLCSVAPGNNAPDPGMAAAFATAAGNLQQKVGCAADNGGSCGVHQINDIYLQDFFQPEREKRFAASDGWTALIYNGNLRKSFLLRTGFWGTYKCLKYKGHRMAGADLLGPPRDEEAVGEVDGRPVDAVQNFQRGRLWWVKSDPRTIHVHLDDFDSYWGDPNNAKETVSDCLDTVGLVVIKNPPGPSRGDDMTTQMDLSSPDLATTDLLDRDFLSLDFASDCIGNGDCMSKGGGACLGGKCQAPTCMDMIKNASETGVDCGGGCPPCAVGNPCNVLGDCAIGLQCVANICTMVQVMPQELATGLSLPYDLALDGMFVYWIENTANGALRKVPKAGGNVATMATGLANPTAVVVDAAYAYILESNNGVNGSIRRVALGGGPLELVASGLTSAQNFLAQDAGFLYWGDYVLNTGGVIKKVAKGQNMMPSLLVQGNGLKNINPPLDVAGQFVYFKNDLNQLLRVSNAGGMPGVVGGTTPDCNAMRVLGSDLIFSDYIKGEINAIPIAGGQYRTLAAGGDRPGDLAVDGNFVYWIERWNPGSVNRIDINGQNRKKYASEANTNGIAVDATHVYWSTSVINMQGRILRTPK